MKNNNIITGVVIAVALFATINLVSQQSASKNGNVANAAYNFIAKALQVQILAPGDD
jgi:hypothetical protein